jgi:outer membrane receptor for ferrienterochelin and colicins
MFLNKDWWFIGVLFTNIVFAQQKHVSDTTKADVLDEVVVTATRTERQLSTLPLPISVITSEEISRTGTPRLNQILNEQTGIILVPDESGFEGIQMQGLDAAYTMILIDGTPLVGRNAGTLDLSRISVGNIDRIEIVKGASSALYGSEAMGGVINVITKKPKYDSLSGNISYQYGTFNTNDINTNISGKKKRFSGQLFTNYFSSDGYDLNPSEPLKNVEKFYNSTINPKLYYDFSKNLKLIVGNRFYHQKQDNTAQIGEDIYRGKAKEDEWNSQTKLEHHWNPKIYSEYELYVTNYKTHAFLNDTEDVFFESTFYNQWLYRPEVRTTFTINKDKITSGVGFNHETLDRTYFERNAVFNSQYVFVQYDYNPTQKWNILAGFRYDNHSEYASQLSPKLAVNYKFNTAFSLKASVGYGYKAPDFRQLFFDFTNPSVGYTVLGYNIGETRLNELEAQGQLLSRSEGISFAEQMEAESAVNYNFGSFYKKNKLRIEANAFYNSISNLIDTKVVAQKTSGQNVFSYFNIGEIFTYGIETNATYQFNKQCSFSVGYQYLVAKDKSVLDDFESHQFVRIPGSVKINKSDYFGLFNRSKHMANMKFLYTIPKLKTDINLRVFYRSKFALMDSNGNQILDRYDTFINEFFITNLTISKHIHEKVTVQVGANNLFDYTNPEQIGNMSGRLIFGKIQFNF